MSQEPQQHDPTSTSEAQGRAASVTSINGLLDHLTPVIWRFPLARKDSTENPEAYFDPWGFKNGRPRPGGQHGATDTSPPTLRNAIHFNHDYRHHKSGVEDAVRYCYQLADCFAVVDDHRDAFYLYYLSIQDTLQIRSLWPSISVQKLLQYLLWGTIGLCTTCYDEASTKLAAICLKHVVEFLSKNSSGDSGTRALLEVYQTCLNGQLVATIPLIHLLQSDCWAWHDLFDSLHPAIRLREIHFLLSIAMQQVQGAALQKLDGVTIMVEIRKQFERQFIPKDSCLPEELLAQHGSFRLAVQRLLPRGVGWVHYWNDQYYSGSARKKFFWILVREYAILGREEMQIFQSPHFLIHFAKYLSEQGIHAKSFERRNPGLDEIDLVGGFMIGNALDMHDSAKVEYLTLAYLEKLRNRCGSLQEDSRVADQVVHRACANQLVMDWSGSAMYSPRILSGSEYNEDKWGGMVEIWEDAADNKSLSTDTRSFISNARRINQKLKMRKLPANSRTSGRSHNAFSDTMSISTNESWQFHRGTGIPEHSEWGLGELIPAIDLIETNENLIGGGKALGEDSDVEMGEATTATFEVFENMHWDE